MKNPIVVALTFLTLAAGLAAGSDKQAPPKPGVPKPYELPTPKRFTLENGLAVTFVDYGTIPKARVELVVDVGNAHETSSQVWLADIAGDLLGEAAHEGIGVARAKRGELAPTLAMLVKRDEDYYGD